jgi:hypothetical protein
LVWDPQAQTAGLDQITDSLDLSGDTEIQYDILISYVTKDVNGNDRTTTDVILPIIIKNPCIDPEYVEIEPPSLDALSYTIGSGEQLYTPHADFTVVTRPVENH